jgi:hypothetical protein
MQPGVRRVLLANSAAALSLVAFHTVYSSNEAYLFSGHA